MEIPYIPPAPPSSVLPRKQPASSKKSFGFYDSRDFSLPPFTQPGSEQDDDNGVEGIAKGVASLSSEDGEMVNSRCGEDGEQFDLAQGARRHPETALVDGSDDELEVLSKRRHTRWQVLDSDDINMDHEARVDQAPSPVDQLSEPHDDSDSEASHDVLFKHHSCNGVPCAPDPIYLESLASKSWTNGGMGAPVAVQNPNINEVQHSVKTELRTGTNNDPTTLKFYDTMWKAILNRAKLLSHLDAVIGNAFPEQHIYINQKVHEFITQAIAELKEDGVQPNKSFLRKHQHHMSDLINLGTYRSDFKKIARQVIVKHWDWEPSDFDDPQQLADHILGLYNDLTEGTKYIHGDCDEEGKFDNFSSMALRDLCMMGYYIGKSSLAALFPNIFGKDLPAGALAFAMTAVSSLSFF
ncbi:hypothetical protein PISMIDRAFT_14390 [Pisolithus microcarpus 441]|uniref:DUF6532 domain-containing protein n=1 Tax=Pisolithus microcarpus 441 TaxID=765257 RepID=A0A0C9ZEN1_9AGAM|nr:hypothetical protein PISMIDRAFT_14390 [Pisolithus microcarpus 441]